MANKAAEAAGVDFVLADNGTATATLTPVDAIGNTAVMPAGASVPVWAASDPAITVTPAQDGLSAILTPTALATGVTVTATATLADGISTITGTSDPIDVVAGPATRFKITEQ